MATKQIVICDNCGAEIKENSFSIAGLEYSTKLVVISTENNATTSVLLAEDAAFCDIKCFHVHVATKLVEQKEIDIKLEA
jgi:hypothetical protein